jgi:hypothetical protein
LVDSLQVHENHHQMGKWRRMRRTKRLFSQWRIHAIVQRRYFIWFIHYQRSELIERRVPALVKVRFEFAMNVKRTRIILGRLVHHSTMLSDMMVQHSWLDRRSFMWVKSRFFKF